ncbi:serine/threonine-protein kinase [Kitasatospora sp. YST-16]|uniref:serine/threonine-protein kinase n=1 Tax=Kitasatospora sp. YST-16 TaxID=2998080 RepID=UPI00228511A7|nr:serine/threonine-protein kinase [Kitasatospora sp. YST-16]WAL76154.1 serine/threonine-protein kinase [Kitasatospora sp. YST-16]WNW36093.1 serine/threonine-protein kinase [Streptomyces sp. Li-HN-5-13]WNW42209.1 serine/threonine-protein kinase [Streptomyces sp. Li-HN-5-13]
MTTAGPGGQLIDGRFELLGRLGGGGMGLVWRARDTMLQREVALKEVRPPDPAMLAADPAAAHELRERVLREAQALARLQHPNVVTIHHIVDNAELAHPWLVMELVTGGSLHDRITRGPLPPQEAARIGRGLLAALTAAHAAGIQHRDVKPGNVLLRPDGTPVLTDFGIAALSESTSLTATGALIGSPEYIAPERIRGHEGDPASDLWSLGMTLYVAVEGHHPLRRANSIATLAAVLDQPLPPPVRSGPLGPTLTALLARDPAERPDAARLDRLFAAAEQGVDGTLGGSPAFSPTETNSPPPYSRTETNGTLPHTPTETVRPGPRRRTGAVLTAAVAVAAAVGLLGWAFGPKLFDGKGGEDPPVAGASAPATAGAVPPAVPSALPSSTAPSKGGPGVGAPASGTDLLTPDGARVLVESIRSSTGSSTIIDMTVRSDNAHAKVVRKDNPARYDTVDYRAGKLTTTTGGVVDSISAKKLVDLGRIDWDQIPTVTATAKSRLAVPQPTDRYLLVDYGWFADEITIRYYLSDDRGSGGGYLTAGATGKVLKVVKSTD